MIIKILKLEGKDTKTLRMKTLTIMMLE